MSGILGVGSKSGVIGETELDYEEGTWTATYRTSANVAGSPGIDNTSYIKIGNVCHLWFRCRTLTASWTHDNATSEASWKFDIPFLKKHGASQADSGGGHTWDAGGGADRLTIGRVTNGGGENTTMVFYVSGREIQTNTAGMYYCQVTYETA